MRKYALVKHDNHRLIVENTVFGDDLDLYVFGDDALIS